MDQSKGCFVVAIATVLLSACAQQPAVEGKPTTEILAARGYVIGEPVSEIRNYRVDGWNSVDSSHVTINAGPSTAYLLTLTGPCTGLLSASDLGFTTTAGSLTTLDKVVIQDVTGKSQCPITKIEKLQRLKREEGSSSSKGTQ